MKENQSSKDIFDAIRSSLHGKSGDIVARLGTDTTVAAVLAKMDSIYGEVDDDTDLLATFYGARQMTSESVSDWGCRLESILDLVKKQGPLPRSQNEMLRKMLWTGLNEDLKKISGYKYDQTDSFDDLRVVLRRLEKQHIGKGKGQQTDKPSEESKSSKKPTPAKAAQSTESSELTEIKAMVQKLSAEVASLKTTPKPDSNISPPDQSQGRNQYGSQQQGYQNQYGSQQGNQNQSGYGRGRQNFRGNSQRRDDSRNWNSPDRRQQQAPHQQQRQPQGQNESPGSGFICYKCGQRGHILIGCRVILDHVRRPQDF